ncbi:alkaline phosphatase D family protein [Actinomadura sp. DC4]|uniref:alkaline phosphatase D family protein n=1 Tax=Actinomadura sp. DC4 TaxID=3055069 RepID=UPI0025B20161|nr:alkaline phosphatase D family protein [Actinomadura sp. DC4]MDN3357152.1 alkaline phosphatase D family protein [Actinomadura sp. DC4]
MGLDRRSFLRNGLVAGGGAALLGTGPHAAALVRSGRPQLTHGVQSGDMSARGAVVWTRADRPSRMLVDVSTRPDFRRFSTVRGPLLTPDTDLTGKVRLDGLPSGERVYYRVRAADLNDASLVSAPVPGGFRTAPRTRRDVGFVWSGDLAGQGFGINPDIGGYRIFKAMQAVDPDFFLCNGDHWYADNPIQATVTLPDGRIYRNLTSPEKSKVAETLAEYRGQHRYNLMDDNLRAFAAAVPQINQWDDHETHNNWYPGEILDDANYTEKRTDVLSARAKQAFFEYLPITQQPHDDGRIYRKISYGPLLDVFVLDMRTYRNANGPDDQTTDRQGILGARQAEWLKRSLAASRATWKIVASDMPISLVVPDADRIEAVSQGDNGGPLGRELQIAGVLSSIKKHRVRNVVWITTDVHYTAAHHYDPAKAAFQDFDPFWEFVSGPLNAGAFGPNTLDLTYGPTVRFQAVPPRANTSPLEGSQFFGEIAIDGHSGELTTRLRDYSGKVLYTVDLPAQR